MEDVRPTFRAFVVRRFGDDGRRWLDDLPALLAEMAERWSLALGPELDGGVLSCVREATTADGEQAVLKLAGAWGHPREEIACLEHWRGSGAPQLLRADAGRGALLLERILPGTHSIDAGATAVAGVLERLHVVPVGAVSPLATAARGRVVRALEEGRTTSAKAQWALEKIDELESSAPTPLLLHGDFDERNLLICEQRGLAAIDPAPCAGDPAYDAGYWAHANGRPGRRARTTAIADALGIGVERVRGWCAVVAVHG